MHGAALLRATFPQSFLIPNALTHGLLHEFEAGGALHSDGNDFSIAVPASPGDLDDPMGWGGGLDEIA